MKLGKKFDLFLFVFFQRLLWSALSAAWLCGSRLWQDESPMDSTGSRHNDPLSHTEWSNPIDLWPVWWVLKKLPFPVTILVMRPYWEEISKKYCGFINWIPFFFWILLLGWSVNLNVYRSAISNNIHVLIRSSATNLHFLKTVVSA